MIWYKLGQGELVDFAESNHLIATYVNYNEILKSKNFLEKTEDSINALKAIKKYAKGYIIYQPYAEFIISCKIPYDCNITEIIYHKIYKNSNEAIYNTLLQDEMFYNNHEQKKKQVNDLIQEKKQEFINDTNYRKGDKKYIHQKEYIEYTKNKTIELICMFIKQIFEGKIELNINWEEHNQYVEAFRLFLIHDTFSTNHKVENNDFFDLAQLLYICRNNLYYSTIEKQWIDETDGRGFISKSVCKDRLVTPY